MTLIVVGLLILLVVILLLVLPLEVELLAMVHGRAEFTARLKLIFGLVSLKVGRTAKREQGLELQPGEKDDFSLIYRLSEAVQTEGIWEQILLLFKSLRNRVQIRRIESNFRISLGDDYYTGMLAGLSMPLSMLAGQQFGSDINLIPLFEEDLIMDGYLRGDIGVYPIEVIVPLMTFIYSRPVRKVRSLLF